MIKKILISIFFLIFSSSILIADEIKKIVIDGNKRITDDTIIVFSGINVGSQVNNDDLNDIVKKLYETNFFKDIKINFKQGILNLKVSENAIIQSVVFNGVKNKRILNTLEENIQLKEKNSFFETYIKDDEDKITNILRTNGYYFAKVDLNNHQRIIRALEVSIFTGKPFSGFLGKKRIKRKFKTKILVIEEDRNILYNKINNRVDLMIKNGLENEVKGLIKYKIKIY